MPSDIKIAISHGPILCTLSDSSFTYSGDSSSLNDEASWWNSA